LGIAARGINTPKSWDLLTLDLASVSDSKCKATVSSFQDAHEIVPSRRYRNPNKPKYEDVKEESGEEGPGIKGPGYIIYVWLWEQGLTPGDGKEAWSSL
jgi:hypothetical protein